MKQNERIECPVNNGADLNSDAMLENLFDDGEYVEHEERGNVHIALGFIDGQAVMAQYWLNTNKIDITVINKYYLADNKESFYKTLKERLSDEQVEPELSTYVYVSTIRCRFYYKPEWVAENNG